MTSPEGKLNFLKMKEIFNGIYLLNNKIYTKNKKDKVRYYGEDVKLIDNFRYREWDPYKSKLAAAIKKNLVDLPIKKDSVILYIGSSTGTTVSHLSDIVFEGKIYSVELSAEMMKLFMNLVYNRSNIYPILADARHPNKYFSLISEKVNFLFQDIPGKNQTEVFIKNSLKFLESEAHAMLSLKTKSIDLREKPGKILEEQKRLLKKYFKITQTINLEPYEKDHWLLHLKMR